MDKQQEYVYYLPELDLITLWYKPDFKVEFGDAVEMCLTNNETLQNYLTLDAIYLGEL